jgi:hypothetical protein
MNRWQVFLRVLYGDMYFFQLEAINFVILRWDLDIFLDAGNFWDIFHGHSQSSLLFFWWSLDWQFSSLEGNWMPTSASLVVHSIRSLYFLHDLNGCFENSYTKPIIINMLIDPRRIFNFKRGITLHEYINDWYSSFESENYLCESNIIFCSQRIYPQHLLIQGQYILCYWVQDR